MILVDTNILIDYLRAENPELNKHFDSISIGICGIVKTELLHGAKDVDEADRLLGFFQSFNLVPIDEYDWEFTGLMLQNIKKNGLTIPLTDVLIAYLGMKYDIPVWTKDHHFRLIQSLYPELRLYE